MLATLFNAFQDNGGRANEAEISYAQFIEYVETGRIVLVEIQGPIISGQLVDGSQFKSFRAARPTAA